MTSATRIGDCQGEVLQCEVEVTCQEKGISGDLPSFRDLSLPPLSFLDFYSLPQRACVVHPPYLALADIRF